MKAFCNFPVDCEDIISVYGGREAVQDLSTGQVFPQTEVQARVHPTV